MYLLRVVPEMTLHHILQLRVPRIFLYRFLRRGQHDSFLAFIFRTGVIIF